jgi:hypothetical protein
MTHWLRRLFNLDEDPPDIHEEVAQRFKELRESEIRLRESEGQQREGDRLAASLHRINRRNHFAEQVDRALRGLTQ